jgi:hypothetical protein
VKASAIPRRAPTVVVRLDPVDFADTYSQRPAGGVAVGLRTISDAQEAQAREEAARSAAHRYEEVHDSEACVEEYNDALMAALVGASLCDPNDLAKDPDALPFPADTVRTALRGRTIRRLFQELELMRADSQARPEADDAALSRVAALLTSGVVAVIDPTRAGRARRLAAAILDTLID